MPDINNETTCESMGSALAEGARSALLGAALGAVGIGLGAGLGKAAAKAACAGAEAAPSAADRVVNEITSTPSDVVSHVRQNPVRAVAETAILGLPGLIIGSKLDKLFK